MHAKFCINCGTEIPLQANFCPNCGTPVEIVNQIIPKMTNGSENGHEWVDLGLSVKWAACNVGANSPEDLGSRFAWGEISSKESFSWTNYRYLAVLRGFIDPDTIRVIDRRTKSFISRNADLIEEMWSYVQTHLTKYTNSDGISHLDISDDAARVNWGGRWRLPSESEFGELRSKCMWEWTIIGGTSGFKVIGPNGNSIFLPANGAKDKSIPFGVFWSSDLNRDDPVYARGFNIKKWEDEPPTFQMKGWGRDAGFSVRPVTD